MPRGQWNSLLLLWSLGFLFCVNKIVWMISSLDDFEGLPDGEIWLPAVLVTVLFSPWSTLYVSKVTIGSMGTGRPVVFQQTIVQTRTLA